MKRILIELHDENKPLYLCNIAFNIMKDEDLYDDLTNRLLIHRSLERIAPCNKNVRNIKHSYCYFGEKDFEGRLEFLNNMISTM